MSYFFKESSKRLSVAFIELNFVFLKKKKDVNHDLCTLPACCLLLLLTLSMQKKSISSPPIHFLWNAFSPVLKRMSGRFLVLGCCTIALHWRCILLPISQKMKWNKKHILSIFFLNSKFSDLWWLTPVPKKHVQNCNSLFFFYFFFFLLRSSRASGSTLLHDNSILSETDRQDAIIHNQSTSADAAAPVQRSCSKQHSLRRRPRL